MNSADQVLKQFTENFAAQVAALRRSGVLPLPLAIRRPQTARTPRFRR